MSLAGVWGRFRAARRPRAITLTLDGFAVEPGTTMRWSDVRDVTAFKRDLMTVDMLCLALRSDAAAVEVNEGMGGYDAFEDALHEALDLSIAWKLDVLFPAFETNATRLYPGPATRLPEGGVQ